jgi:hypothetical protein
MATLNQTAGNLRRVILIAIVAMVVILALDTAGKFLNSRYNPFNEIPSFYLDANGLLGNIPEPNIPSLAIADSSNPTFTIEGAFGSFPNTGLVYAINQPRLTLDTTDNAESTATALGFTAQYTTIGEDTLRWQNPSETRSLSFQQLTKTWEMRTQYFFDAVAQLPKQVNTAANFYENKVSQVLSRLGFDEQNIRENEVIISYSELGVNGLFTKPLEARNADYVSIDVYRQLQAALPKPRNQLTEAQTQIENPPLEVKGLVYTQDPRKGSLRIIASDQLEDLTRDIYALDFIDFDYNYSPGVYNILSPAEAWERVRQGEGSLVLLQLQTDDYFAPNRSLSVNRFAADASQTELGFYEPSQWDGFAYPIYIFRGRVDTAEDTTGRFVFYIDALQRT